MRLSAFRLPSFRFEGRKKEKLQLALRRENESAWLFEV
jgi:hypothetical protein